MSEQLEFKEPRPLGADINTESELWWNDYFQRSRGVEDVHYLWSNTDLPAGIRQRALAMLTSPGYVDRDFPYSMDTTFIREFLDFAKGNAADQPSELRQDITERPELVDELVDGVLFWIGQNDLMRDKDFNSPTGMYVDAIICLLPYASEAKAEELFAHFPKVLTAADQPTYDHESTFKNAQQNTYNYTARLLGNPHVPGRYKDIALEQWISAIRTDKGQQADSFSAMDRLTDVLIGMASGAEYIDNRTADPMIRDQIIGFMEAEGRDIPGSHYPVHQTHMIKLLGLARGTDQEFAMGSRYLDPSSSEAVEDAKIFDEEDLLTIESLRNYIRPGMQPDFEARLQHMIEGYYERQAARQEEKAAEQAKEDELQARLLSLPA